jgi:tagatose-1,6-bisphosphate aldolase non-catalytic subunit AgaZ/GatZ
MSDEEKAAAAEHARQAAGQGKAAARNAAKAAKETAEVAADEIADNVHKLGDVAHEAAQAVKNAPSLTDTIITASFGTIALATSVGCAAVGISVFRGLIKAHRA